MTMMMLSLCIIYLRPLGTGCSCRLPFDDGSNIERNVYVHGRPFMGGPQWRRAVVKYGGQGHGCQAIRLFQITPSPQMGGVYCFTALRLYTPPSAGSCVHEGACAALSDVNNNEKFRSH